MTKGERIMSDTLREMTQMVQNFCEERDWDQYHTPKELAIGLVTEASELLDLFRFQTDAQIEAQLLRPDQRTAIEDEVADVLFFLLRMAQRNNFNLRDVLQRKIQKNALKYPVERARSSNAKYTQLKD
jgi:NTP pyrophosphatase (non-canonical NTP hydrolase)